MTYEQLSKEEALTLASKVDSWKKIRDEKERFYGTTIAGDHGYLGTGHYKKFFGKLEELNINIEINRGSLSSRLKYILTIYSYGEKIANYFRDGGNWLNCSDDDVMELCLSVEKKVEEELWKKEKEQKARQERKQSNLMKKLVNEARKSI